MLALPKPDAKPTRGRVGHRPPGLARVREAAAERPTRRPSRPRRRTTARRRAAGQGSACSRTRRARTRRPPAAPSRSSCARAASTARSRPPARSASPATRSSSSSLKVGSQVPGRHRARPHRRAPRRPSTRTCASRSARPAAAPRAIDPKPILDGWKLLESTAIYRAKGKNPFVGPDAATPTIGQILLMSKETLQPARARRPADPDLRLRPPGHPGRRDRPPRAGHARVPRRLGLQPDGHRRCNCGHSYLTASGNVSEHTHRHRGRHRRRQRHPDPRPPGQGLDHRARDPAPADAAGHDEAAPDHLADDVPGRRQHALAARPRRPHPRRLPPAVRHQHRSSPSSSTRSSSPASGRA